MRYLLLIISCLLLLSCKTKRAENAAPANKTGTQATNHSVALLPFKGIDSTVVLEIRKGIASRLQVEVTVLKEVALPASAFYVPRQRYVADSLLAFLRRHKHDRYEKIIGITSKDIATRKGEHPNFGVMGLGNCPGPACVISSFRVGKGMRSRKHFLDRMVVLALHELGHTYSLPHCPDTACLMKDAEGKMNLDDGQTYCQSCRAILLKKGVLRSATDQK